MQSTLVFLHGIFGSRLETPSGEEVWPPKVSEWVRKSYKRTDALLRSDLTVTGIVRSVACCDVYRPILDDFEAIGFGDRGDKGPLVIFAYDWRRDLRSTANTLADTLDGLDGSHSIHLVAHSMGGLVCRYILESGHFTTRPWFSRIRELITLATPHLGAPKALLRAAGLEGAMGMSKKDVKRLASDPRYPSAYQLVPPRGTAYVRNIDDGVEDGRVIDPFSAEFIAALGLSRPNMQANAAFYAELDLRDRKPAHVDYYLFASSTQKTNNRFQQVGKKLIPLEDQKGGDDTVPTFSAGSPFATTEYVSGTHGKIFNSSQLRFKLYRLLGAPDTVFPVSSTGEAAVDQPVENLVIPDEAIGKNETFEITIVFQRDVTQFEDTIVFEPIREIGLEEVPIGDGAVLDLRYDGPAIQTLTIRVQAPRKAGFYKVSLRESSLGNPVPLTLTVSTN